MQRVLFGVLVVALTATVLLSGWQRHRTHATRVCPKDLPPAGLTGTIYYYQPGEPARMWCVELDSRTVRPLAKDIRGEPSRELHSGQRWFATTLPVPGETFRDGSPMQRLCLIAEDGTIVTLCHQPDLQPAPYSIRWLRSDAALAWIARRLDENGKPIEGGIYESRIAIGRDGHLIGLLEPPDAPRLRFELVPDSWPDLSPDLVPDVCSFDYSPDGNMIVYESTSQQMYVCDITRGESRSLQAGTGYDPVWSLDGQRILFRTGESFGPLVSVKPDGRDRIDLVRGLPGYSVVTHPITGPDGEYFVYAQTRNEGLEAGVNLDLLIRAPMVSGDCAVAVNLPPHTMPIAWR